MKNLIRLSAAFLLAAFVSGSTFAQSQGMPFQFQGYAVDADGANISNETIQVKVTLTSSGTIVQSYTETHTGVITDAFGVFIVEVGSKSPANFKKLNFTTLEDDDFVFKIEATFEGTTVTILDESMKAVPYAKSAGNGNPVGTVIAFAGQMDKLPAGWLVCDGRKLNTSTNPEYKQLANVLGSTWGEATATEFYLPDLRARFLRGSEEGQTAATNNASADGDAATTLKVGNKQNPALIAHGHAASASSAGSHTHNFRDVFHSEASPPAGVATIPNATNVYGGKGGSDADNVWWFRNETTDAAGDHTHTITVGAHNVHTSQTETRPFSAVVVYIIKY